MQNILCLVTYVIAVITLLVCEFTVLNNEISISVRASCNLLLYYLSLPFKWCWVSQHSSYYSNEEIFLTLALILSLTLYCRWMADSVLQLHLLICAMILCSAFFCGQQSNFLFVCCVLVLTRYYVKKVKMSKKKMSFSHNNLHTHQSLHFLPLLQIRVLEAAGKVQC